ncbi:MAG TPA: hypothetical protein VJY54_11970 [Lachnospiraceae bacterium]|nr:hypothetical protein [Lachnospiraceae bacterium]
MLLVYACSGILASLLFYGYMSECTGGYKNCRVPQTEDIICS